MKDNFWRDCAALFLIANLPREYQAYLEDLAAGNVRAAEEKAEQDNEKSGAGTFCLRCSFVLRWPPVIRMYSSAQALSANNKLSSKQSAACVQDHKWSVVPPRQATSLGWVPGLPQAWLGQRPTNLLWSGFTLQASRLECDVKAKPG